MGRIAESKKIPDVNSSCIAVYVLKRKGISRLNLYICVMRCEDVASLVVDANLIENRRHITSLVSFSRLKLMIGILCAVMIQSCPMTYVCGGFLRKNYVKNRARKL
jgi:hypothetical protein